MTKKDLLVYVAAILTALLDASDAGGMGTPESMLYLGIGMDMEKYSVVRDVLVRAGFVSIRNYQVTLTALGRETAGKINAAVSA